MDQLRYETSYILSSLEVNELIAQKYIPRLEIGQFWAFDKIRG